VRKTGAVPVFRFGFKRKERHPEGPSLFGANGLPPGMTLVSKEDVYAAHQDDESSDSKRQVLLVKAGTAVKLADLPKLIRYGAKPHQFRLEKQQSSGKVQTTDLDEHLVRVMTEPQRANLSAPQIMLNKDALVVETDDRAMNRMMDCLSACGIPLHRVHPIYLMSHLFWALDKYNAKIVAMGIHANVNYQELYDTLQKLKARQLVETIILTVDDSFRSQSSMEWLDDLADTYDVHVVFKPVSRFVLRPVLLGTENSLIKR
jgi:hypothetical protein